ncbi:MAG: sigma 54-interacting transcriptional regulator [Gammaproteobacteria bacterium]|nr:sigma 54-interacting transcriptional regulator [Gammaproteobacteria bacterium]
MTTNTANRAALERYQWFFREGSHLVTATDKTGRFYDVSTAFATRLGRTREELLTMSHKDIASPATLKQLENEWLPCLKKNQRLQDIPIEYVTPNGECIKFVADTVSGQTDSDGEFVCLSYYREIDDWDRISHRFQSLYRAAPAMLHTLDMQARIIEVSDRWLFKLGYTRAEVIGRSIADFYTSTVKKDLEGGQLTLLTFAEEYSNHPREMVTKSGEVLEVLVSAAQVQNRRGEVIRLQVAIKDVTDRNKALNDLQAAFSENARLRKELEQERDYLRETVNVSMNYGKIVGNSEALKTMMSRIDAVAHTTANVMIVGESGTGKELVSHAIHSRSARKDKPLVTVNCASIPRELFESEFFGHVRGAFTGATRDRVGRFQLANGGTIFLDEVGEIPLELQGKLLRVLQEQQFERVGDDETLNIDVRIIAATNRHLEKEVAEGRFREDLFYRLNVFPIEVPPLRMRGDDVIQIAAHLVTTICADLGRKIIPLTERDIRALRGYDWPGNVRELRNVLERAIILSVDERLRLSLPRRDEPPLQNNPQPQHHNDYLTDDEIKAFLKQNTIAALKAANWKVSGTDGAAELLGIKPTTLSDRIRAYRIQRPPRRRGRPSPAA